MPETSGKYSTSSPELLIFVLFLKIVKRQEALGTRLGILYTKKVKLCNNECFIYGNDCIILQIAARMLCVYFLASFDGNSFTKTNK